jgi:hypothetical protein
MPKSLGDRLRILICLNVLGDRVSHLSRPELASLHSFKNEVVAAIDKLYGHMPPAKSDPVIEDILKIILDEDG